MEDDDDDIDSRAFATAVALSGQRLLSLATTPWLFSCRFAVTVDLSNNELLSIGLGDEALRRRLDPEASPWSSLSALRSLYLHGNQLTNLNEVRSLLAPVKTLQYLTLAGNPFPGHYSYRAEIVTGLPQLLGLDDYVVADAERLRFPTPRGLPWRHRPLMRHMRVPLPRVSSVHELVSETSAHFSVVAATYRNTSACIKIQCCWRRCRAKVLLAAALSRSRMRYIRRTPLHVCQSAIRRFLAVRMMLGKFIERSGVRHLYVAQPRMLEHIENELLVRYHRVNQRKLEESLQQHGVHVDVSSSRLYSNASASVNEAADLASPPAFDVVKNDCMYALVREHSTLALRECRSKPLGTVHYSTAIFANKQSDALKRKRRQERVVLTDEEKTKQILSGMGRRTSGDKGASLTDPGGALHFAHGSLHHFMAKNRVLAERRAQSALNDEAEIMRRGQQQQQRRSSSAVQPRQPPTLPPPTTYRRAMPGTDAANSDAAPLSASSGGNKPTSHWDNLIAEVQRRTTAHQKRSQQQQKAGAALNLHRPLTKIVVYDRNALCYLLHHNMCRKDVQTAYGSLYLERDLKRIIAANQIQRWWRGTNCRRTVRHRMFVRGHPHVSIKAATYFVVITQRTWRRHCALKRFHFLRLARQVAAHANSSVCSMALSSLVRLAPSIYTRTPPPSFMVEQRAWLTALRLVVNHVGEERLVLVSSPELTERLPHWLLTSGALVDPERVSSNAVADVSPLLCIESGAQVSISQPYSNDCSPPGSALLKSTKSSSGQKNANNSRQLIGLEAFAETLSMRVERHGADVLVSNMNTHVEVVYRSRPDALMHSLTLFFLTYDVFTETCTCFEPKRYIETFNAATKLQRWWIDVMRERQMERSAKQRRLEADSMVSPNTYRARGVRFMASDLQKTLGTLLQSVEILPSPSIDRSDTFTYSNDEQTMASRRLDMSDETQVVDAARYSSAGLFRSGVRARKIDILDTIEEGAASTGVLPPPNDLNATRTSQTLGNVDASRSEDDGTAIAMKGEAVPLTPRLGYHDAQVQNIRTQQQRAREQAVALADAIEQRQVELEVDFSRTRERVSEAKREKSASVRLRTARKVPLGGFTVKRASSGTALNNIAVVLTRNDSNLNTYGRRGVPNLRYLDENGDPVGQLQGKVYVGPEAVPSTAREPVPPPSSATSQVGRRPQTARDHVDRTLSRTPSSQGMQSRASGEKKPYVIRYRLGQAVLRQRSPEAKPRKSVVETHETPIPEPPAPIVGMARRMTLKQTTVEEAKTKFHRRRHDEERAYFRTAHGNSDAEVSQRKERLEQEEAARLHAIRQQKEASRAHKKLMSEAAAFAKDYSKKQWRFAKQMQHKDDERTKASERAEQHKLRESVLARQRWRRDVLQEQFLLYVDRKKDV